MTLDEFKAMSPAEMCEKMNKHMESHTARNFKGADMNFSLAQAEKALEEKGIYKLAGVYRTEGEMLSFFEQKQKERNKKELSQDNIEQLLELLQPETFHKLKLLAEKYNYVSSYILREEKGIRIKTGREDDIRSSSVRVYGETMDRWKEFVKQNRAYSATDLLNTALLEFMERH